MCGDDVVEFECLCDDGAGCSRCKVVERERLGRGQSRRTANDLVDEVIIRVRLDDLDAIADVAVSGLGLA